MKKWLITFSICLITSCAGKNIEQYSAKPRLDIVATQTSSEVKLYVQLLGSIPEGDKRFYCPDQLWEFGNGESNYYVFRCTDYSSKYSWSTKRDFREYYAYPNKGEYEVKLTLLKNGKVLVASQGYKVLVK